MNLKNFLTSFLIQKKNILLKIFLWVFLVFFFSFLIFSEKSFFLEDIKKFFTSDARISYDDRIIEVVKIFPKWEIKNLSQKIWVLFSENLIPLSSVSWKEISNCPIKIIPEISWKCKWISWNYLEFSPEKILDYWVKYEIFLEKSKNFPIEKNISSSFKTIAKSEKKWNEINQIYSIQENMSWSVVLNEKRNIVFSNYSQKNSNILPIWNFNLEVGFSDEIKKINKKNFVFTQSWKILDFQVQYKIYENYLWNKVKQKRNLIFSFDENFWNEEEIKFSVKKDFFWELFKEKNNTLEAISEKSDKETESEKSDFWFEKTFKTASKLKFINSEFLPNRELCLYFNNKISRNSWYSEELKNFLSFEKFWKIVDLKEVSENVFDWKFKQKLKWKTLEEKNIILKNEWKCLLPKKWNFWYSVYFQSPLDLENKLFISENLKDFYWNELWEKKEISFKTWKAKYEDEFIYSSLSNEIVKIPDNLEIVVNFQTANLKTSVIEICEMNKNWFLNFLEKKDKKNFAPKCEKKVVKKFDLHDSWWNFANNKFNLEKDFLWEKFSQNFILVRASSDWKFWKWKDYNWKNWFFENWKETRNLFIREWFSAFLEKWKPNNVAFVTNFEWEILEWVDFEFFSKEWNNPFKKIRTNIIFDKKKWVYKYYWIWEKLAFLEKNWQIAILDFNKNAVSNYDFWYISWHSTNQKKYSYLYTDRPIYKTWDEVYLKWIVREFSENWYKKSGIKKWIVKIRNQNWEDLKTFKVDLDENWNFSKKFTIPESFWLWVFTVYFWVWDNFHWIDNFYWTYNFYIEEYKKPDFKIVINSDLEKNNLQNNLQNSFLPWDNLNLNISAEYYSWWKIFDSEWKFSVSSQKYFFDAKNFSNYQFWEWYEYYSCLYWWSCNFWDKHISSEKFSLNSNWEFVMNYKFSKEDSDFEKIYNFDFEIIDPFTKKSITTRISKVLHSTNWYVWIQTPYFSKKDDWVNFSAVLLDWNAELISWKIDLEIFKIEHKTVKKQWVDWVFYNENSVDEKLEKTLSLETKDWNISERIFTENSWEYKIKAIYTWENWENFISSKNIFVWWEKKFFWWESNNHKTDLIVEKEFLNFWETANLTLKSPVSEWKVIFFIEKDNYILDYFVEDLDSNAQNFSFKIKDNYYPNIYIRAILIWKQKWNPLPIYKVAVSQIRVNTESKKIIWEISTDKKIYKPWEKVEITILTQDSIWNPISTNWSISIVDESLLALKWNPKKNPFAFFYDLKRYLWTYSIISLTNLIEKLEIKDIWNWEKWWAWETTKWWDSKKKRWDFRDTAFYKFNFKTDENWFAKIEIPKLPDNLTSWQIEALFNSQDSKFWVAYLDFSTKKEIFLSSNLPRFLWTSDKIIFSPKISNTWEKDLDLKLEFYWEDLIFSNWKNLISKDFLIKKWESKNIYINWEVIKNISNNISNLNKNFTTISIKILDNNWEILDWIERKIWIENNFSREVVATTWKMEKYKKTEKIILDENLNNWILKINYWATLISNVLDWVNFLEKFPYWCFEQQISALMPNIFIKNLYTWAWEEFNLSEKFYFDEKNNFEKISYVEKMENFLNSINKFQAEDWWFSYWNSQHKKWDFYLTSYFLAQIPDIKKAWFSVNEKIINEAKKFVQKWIYSKGYYKVLKMIWLANLTDLEPCDYENYKIWKNISNWENFEIWDKIAELKVIWNFLICEENFSEVEKNIFKKKAEEITNKIISEKIEINPRWASLWNIDLTLDFISAISKFSNLSKTSLSDWVLSKWNKQIFEQIHRYLISEKNNFQKLSTQQNIKLIKSFAEIAENQDLKNIKLKSEISINWKKTWEEKNIWENKFKTFSEEISLENLKKENYIDFEKSWEDPLFYDLVLDYFLPVENLKAVDEWFFVQKKYFDYKNFQKIKIQKFQEFEKFENWEIEKKEMKFSWEIFDYLEEISEFKVGQKVIVQNIIITSKNREQVAFEWFLPSWAEILNSNLATENFENFQNNFDVEEARDDRFFGFRYNLNQWKFSFSYLIRFTHSWDFLVRPTRVSGFYNPEVFGRTDWGVLKIR